MSLSSIERLLRRSPSALSLLCVPIARPLLRISTLPPPHQHPRKILQLHDHDHEAGARGNLSHETRTKSNADVPEQRRHERGDPDDQRGNEGGGERSWSGRGTARSDDGDGDGGEYGRRRGVLRGAEGAGGYYGDLVLLEGTSPTTTRHKSKNVFIIFIVGQGKQENLLRAQRELNR